MFERFAETSITDPHTGETRLTLNEQFRQFQLSAEGMLKSEMPEDDEILRSDFSHETLIGLIVYDNGGCCIEMHNHPDDPSSNCYKVHICNENYESFSLVELEIELFCFYIGGTDLWVQLMRSLDSVRYTLARDVQKCDPNGTWADECLDLEPFTRPATIEELLRFTEDCC